MEMFLKRSWEGEGFTTNPGFFLLLGGGGGHSMFYGLFKVLVQYGSILKFQVSDFCS